MIQRNTNTQTHPHTHTHTHTCIKFLEIGCSTNFSNLRNKFIDELAIFDICLEREILFSLLMWSLAGKSNFIASPALRIAWYYKTELMEEKKKRERIKNEGKGGDTCG